MKEQAIAQEWGKRIASYPEMRIFQFLYIENSYNMLDVWKGLDAFKSLWKRFSLVLIIFLGVIFLFST